MNAKFLLLFLAFVLISVHSKSWADGKMELKGKVVSFDANTIEVSDKLHVYLLQRSAVSLKVLKPGQDVDLWVPFDSITSIKDLKPKK